MDTRTTSSRWCHTSHTSPHVPPHPPWSRARPQKLKFLRQNAQNDFAHRQVRTIFRMFDLELTFCSYCAADRAGVLKPVLHARDISPKQRAGRGAGRGGTAGGIQIHTQSSVYGMWRRRMSANNNKERMAKRIRFVRLTSTSRRTTHRTPHLNVMLQRFLISDKWEPWTRVLTMLPGYQTAWSQRGAA